MSRIPRIFDQLRRDRRKAIMPFVTAGYPTLAHTAAILPALQRAGAAIVEVGIPFSDPIADGPVIQASMTKALETGVHVADIFKTVAELRQSLELGLVAMVSYSIVHRVGIDKFIQHAASSGFDGFIFPDLPLEERDAVTKPVTDAGLTCSLLVAPTTPASRAEQIARACTGFVYVVARTGITGERDSVPEGLSQRVSQLRQATDLPIAVGFGIGKPQHVKAVVEHADAAIVGSALVRQITEHIKQPPEVVADHVERFVRDLAGGLK